MHTCKYKLWACSSYSNTRVHQQRELNSVCACRVQLNEAQDEIMKKKELLEDLQHDNSQTCINTYLIFYITTHQHAENSVT